MRAVRLCLGFLVLLVAVSPIAHGQGVMTWEPGMYWTYDATLTWGQTRTSQITLVVAHADAFSGFGAWVVVGICNGFSGVELASAAVVIGPPEIYVRWPIVVTFLEAFEPVSAIPSVAAWTTLMPASIGNAPVRIETVSRAPNLGLPEGPGQLDWLDRDLADWETPEIVTLVGGEAAELALATGVFPGAQPLRYERTRGDRHSGTAWWLPDLLCWGVAEGTETIQYAQSAYEYRIELTGWGRWSNAESATRIGTALDAMSLLRPEQAEWYRAYLRSLGVDL